MVLFFLSLFFYFKVYATSGFFIISAIIVSLMIFPFIILFNQHSAFFGFSFYSVMCYINVIAMVAEGIIFYEDRYLRYLERRGKVKE